MIPQASQIRQNDKPKPGHHHCLRLPTENQETPSCARRGTGMQGERILSPRAILMDPFWSFVPTPDTVL